MWVPVLIIQPSLQFLVAEMPKYENYDCSDFYDFYIIKSFWVGDFVVII